MADLNAPIRNPKYKIDKNGNQIDSQTGQLASTTLLAPEVSQAVADVRNSVSDFFAGDKPAAQQVMQQRVGAEPVDSNKLLPANMQSNPDNDMRELEDQIYMLSSDPNTQLPGSPKQKQLELLQSKLNNMKSMHTPLHVPTQMAPLLRPQ